MEHSRLFTFLRIQTVGRSIGGAGCGKEVILFPLLDMISIVTLGQEKEKGKKNSVKKKNKKKRKETREGYRFLNILLLHIFYLPANWS